MTGFSEIAGLFCVLYMSRYGKKEIRLTQAIDKFTDADKQTVIDLFSNGLTMQEIGDIIGQPRRTVGKLCKHLGLSRSVKEAAELKNKSNLDNPQTIAAIKEMRDNHSLEEIATKLGSSVSAIHRICKKHGIIFDKERYAKMQAGKMMLAWNDEKRAIASVKAMENVTDELRDKLSKNSKRLWQQGKYRKIQSIRRAEQSHRISSIQNILYDILNDLGVKYYREYDDKPNDPETVLGPYNFDCAIPREKDILLIECQGDYWHSINRAVVKDEQKRSYISNNFAGRYELKYIWEHEFKSKDRVKDLLQYWLGRHKLELVDFDFSEVKIVKINAKTANGLLDRYHYLSGCGRGGVLYGAFIHGQLTAVCAFSSLVRQNLPYDNKSARELSRFCIHPSYQKKNFGSWFMSRAMKMLPRHIKTIISYCDTTFNHDGALYKACNFVLDGTVKPDYWYVDDGGWVTHKKKLYDHATKMGKKEREYAEELGYKRVYGAEKLRFIKSI